MLLQKPDRLWWLLAVGGAALLATPGLGYVRESYDGVRCADIDDLGIRVQENIRAGLILAECEGTSFETDSEESMGAQASALFEPLRFSNVDVITGDENYPHVTQSESMVWKHGLTVVVNVNDSAGARANYSGVSVSIDGGATFTRLLPAPFATGHGTNIGDPVVVFNEALQLWFAGDLVSGGCGHQGIGLWTSSDGLNWTPGACAHVGKSDDRESMSVDNNPDSATFGRMYISWNDFAAGQRLFVTTSDDGVNWSTPTSISDTFIRNLQLTVPPDGNSTAFLAGMDEMGGGIGRQNLIYRTIDGGNTWSTVYLGPIFRAPGLSPGASFCGYFWYIPTIWRHMGWGQPAAGPRGHVHYAYAGKGLSGGSDLGDIFYIGSDDNGDTWSEPMVLNTDQAKGGTREQWMPSVSAGEDGSVFVAWYDRRNTSDGLNYQYWGRLSLNHGHTWLNDVAVSDVVSPQFKQPDGAMNPCYAGDYNYHSADGATHLLTWTDGRKLVNSVSQEDVFFAQTDAFQGIFVQLSSIGPSP